MKPHILSTIYIVQLHEDTRFCLHTVLVGSYYWTTPAEAHHLLIQGEKVQKKIANTKQTKPTKQANRSPRGNTQRL